MDLGSIPPVNKQLVSFLLSVRAAAYRRHHAPTVPIFFGEPPKSRVFRAGSQFPWWTLPWESLPSHQRHISRRACSQDSRPRYSFFALPTIPRGLFSSSEFHCQTLGDIRQIQRDTHRLGYSEIQNATGNMTTNQRRQVVILGVGYAGSSAAKALDKANGIDVTVVAPEEGYVLHKIAGLRAAVKGDEW
jgi:hypothetical protein